MTRFDATVGAVALGLCATTAVAQESPARPDLESCASLDVASDGYTFGTTPVAVPAEFASIMTADAERLAFLALDGSTECNGLAWISQFDAAEWFVEGRLLGMRHVGYESFGYWLIDRAGGGTLVETGARPVFSEDGSRFASVQLSEAGWGGMEGFAVWELTDSEPRLLSSRVAGQATVWVPPTPFDGYAFDWRIDGWQGNDCVQLSAIRYSKRPPYEPAEHRTVLSARAADGWAVVGGACQ